MAMQKLKKYSSTKSKAKDSRCTKDAVDYAVGFIECLCRHTKEHLAQSYRTYFKGILSFRQKYDCIEY